MEWAGRLARFFRLCRWREGGGEDAATRKRKAKEAEGMARVAREAERRDEQKRAVASADMDRMSLSCGAELVENDKLRSLDL